MFFVLSGYMQNWHLVWSGTSYFTAFAAPSPLRHLWSPAIEEQFNVVWPLTLVLLLAPRLEALIPPGPVFATKTAPGSSTTTTTVPR